MHRTVPLFISTARISYSTMIPAVVLALLLATPTFSLPVTTQEFATAGTQGTQAILPNTGHPQGTTGEKSQVGGLPHTTAGTGEGSSVETSGTKTGAGGIPTGAIQNVDKIEQEYTGTVQTVEAIITRGHSGTPTQYTGSETTSQAEQTGVQVPSAGHKHSENYPQNTPFTQVENVPVDQKQPYQPENPLLLPIQPLTAVPVSQVGEFLEPVVVPAETITAGRVIIMAIKPIQQRNFQDVTPQIPYQQVIQAVTGSEQTQTPGFGQQIEKEEIQRGGQTHAPVQQQPDQVPSVKEQVPHNPEVVQQTAEQVPNYVPVSAAEPNPQTYSIQQVQPVVGEPIQKQVPQQPNGYTQGQTQFVESTLPQQQTYNVQQPTEKQGAPQQTGYDTVQHQVQTLYQQQDNPVAAGSVQLNQPYQVSQSVEKRTSAPGHQQQSGERQTPYQQGTQYVPVQNQQQTETESYIPAEPQPVRQVTPGQSGYVPVQPHSPEQTQTTYQSGEKQVPVQTVQYVPENPQEPIHQQQVQSFAVVPTASQLPVQPVHTETAEYVPQQLQKTAEEQPNRVVGAQPPQVVNYAEPIYNFGDKIPQNPTVQQSSPFASCQQ